MKKPAKNKSGVLVLQDDEDLAARFLGEEPAGRGQDDFAALLEQSLDATDVQDALEMKEANGAGLSPERMTEQLRQYPRPQSELDLHHYTASDAAARTEYFIRSAAQRGLKTLRIITGKGLHSGGRAVLPDVVEQVLVSLKRKDIVLTFVWEHRSKTRSGSVIVYLRKKSPESR